MIFRNQLKSASPLQTLAALKLLLPILILLIGLAFSLQQYRSAKEQSDATLKARFNTAFNEVTLHIIEKIQVYEQMLRATKGLFYASDEVSRQEFRNFARQMDIDNFYPGLQGLGYVPLIKPEDKAKHVAQVRDRGFPNYSIHPEGEREFYTSILYLEPFTDRNLRAFGFDMASEPSRREAMLKARDTQAVALSAGVKLIQDQYAEGATGLLMYLPLFRDVTLLGGQQTRQESVHDGWVYSVFRVDDVVNTTLAFSNNVSEFRITDISDGERQTIFQTAMSGNDRMMMSKAIKLGGRLWLFEGQPDARFISNYEDSSPLHGLLFGILFSIGLAWISWLITNGRVRAENMASQMTSQLREKNQRLSLATETARMGVWDWDFANNQLNVDGSLAKFMGIKTSAGHRVSYEEWFKFVEESDRQRLKSAIDKTIRERQELNIQVLVQPEDGFTRMLQLSAVLKFNNNGQPTGMLGVSFDITERWLSQQQLAQTEARWKHALEGSGEGVWDWSIIDDRVIFSEQLITMLGFEPGEFETNLSEWADRIHPDDREHVFEDIDALLDGSKPDYRNEHRMLCKDGSWKWILDRGTVIERDADGQPLRAIGTHSDISWRKEAEITLRMSEERFRNAFDTAAIGMALVGIDGRWLEVNDALCEMLGYSERELLGKTFMDVTHPEDVDADQQYVEKLIRDELDHYQMEKRYLHKNGQVIDVLLNVSGVHDADGKIAHFVSQIEDITARKHEQERMRLLAFYDFLTGLPNRRLFEERISQAMLSARRNKKILALMLIDVDHFKHINDNYGHDIGDEVVKAVAEKMQGVLRASDTLARFGGDEFVVLLNDVPASEAALKVAENLRQPFTEKLAFADCAVRIRLSIGVAIWSPDQDESIASLMKKADMALYDAKAQGRNGVRLYQSAAD